jgi:hypothetical protein
MSTTTSYFFFSFRYDAENLLEKRVLSRFSHRKLYLSKVLPLSQYTLAFQEALMASPEIRSVVSLSVDRSTQHHHNHRDYHGRDEEGRYDSPTAQHRTVKSQRLWSCVCVLLKRICTKCHCV